MTEVIAGRIDFFFGPVALVLPQFRERKLTALAVNGSRRSAVLPNVPTTLEAGVADAEYPIWLGLFLPTKTPRHIVDKLNRETVKALQEPKVRDKLAALGFEPMVMTPANSMRTLKRKSPSTQRWSKRPASSRTDRGGGGREGEGGGERGVEGGREEGGR